MFSRAVAITTRSALKSAPLQRSFTRCAPLCADFMHKGKPKSYPPGRDLAHAHANPHADANDINDLENELVRERELPSDKVIIEELLATLDREIKEDKKDDFEPADSEL